MKPPVKYLSAMERRSETVKAVIDLAAEQNPSEITTSSIASRMGLSQGALFRHFPNKEAMLQEVMAWVAEKLLSGIERTSQEGIPSLEVLEAMFMAHIYFVAENPGVPRILFSELQRKEMTAPKRIAQMLIQKYKDRLCRVLEKGKKIGEIDSFLDSEAGAVLFIGTIQGLIMQSLLEGNMERIRHDAPKAFAIYRRGIEKSR
jgi:AcrR family transcriptional regulator